MEGYTRISRKEFYEGGGFSNPRLVRAQRRNYPWITWSYWKRND